MFGICFCVFVHVSAAAAAAAAVMFTAFCMLGLEGVYIGGVRYRKTECQTKASLEGRKLSIYFQYFYFPLMLVKKLTNQKTAGSCSLSLSTTRGLFTINTLYDRAVT